MLRRLTASLACAALAVVASGCAGDRTAGDSGESYPTKNPTLIVQAAAGGASDMTARALASEMEKDLGTDIVVENRPGAAGSIAMKHLADAEPDGYTIGYLPVEVSMLEHQGYDVQPDSYDLLGQVVNVPAVVVVPADSPHRSLEDLVGQAKNEPNSVSVANAGAGSIWDAATKLLGKASGASFKPVPFDGGAPAVKAAAAGDVNAAVAGVSEVAPAVDDGRVRALAIMDDESSDKLPDVPTAGDAGYDLAVGGWGGIGAPAGLPDNVRERLESAVRKAAQSDSFTSTIGNAGAVPTYRNAAEFGKFAAQESQRFAGVLRDGS